MARPPSHRPSFKHRVYRRAVSGDLDFGHICPTCAGPKTDQALRCRKCFADALVTHGLTRKGVMQGQRWRSENRLTNYHGPGSLQASGASVRVSPFLGERADPEDPGRASRRRTR